MKNQKSLELSSKQFKKPQIKNAKSLVPVDKSYEQNYVIYRIGLAPMEISERARNGILQALAQDRNYVQVGDHTIMLNSMKAIEPIPRKSKQMKEAVDDKKKELGIM